MVKSLWLTGEMTMTGYRQMAAKIAARIVAGEWPAGGRVPTTKQFAAEYGASEYTAYRALSLLIDRGLLIGKRGGGRYVAPLR